MKNALIVAALAGALLAVVFLVAPPRNAFRIESRILGEGRTILESLPAGYESSGKAYPVLIHLDASAQAFGRDPSFYDVAKTVNSLGKPVPEMIVLGVRNTRRNRDMIPAGESSTAGGARNFLRFLAEELIPALRTRYRAEDYRILYGRSDSGLFALYALTEAPDAFQAVIASSPSLERCPVFMAKAMSRFLRERPSLARKLFIIYGSKERYVAVRVPEYAELIRQAASESFALGVKNVPGGGHVPPSSLEDGLRFVFK